MFIQRCYGIELNSLVKEAIQIGFAIVMHMKSSQFK